MRPRADDRTPAGLLAAARGGERRAAARLLTIVEHGGPAAEEVAEATHPLSGGAHVVGITGAPGSGKSTLVGVLATRVAEAGGRPAVVAVDPSSPLTGGAILGDRVRMEAATAAGAFIRSVATRGHGGGLALSVPGSVRVLDACGFDPIVVETVGVGQVEVDVAAAADTTVVVVTPGWGDAVQANKAGLLEVADLFVVNKADRPGADDARRDLELMLDLSEVSGSAGDDRPAVLSTTATAGDGVDRVLAAVEDHHRRLAAGKGLVGRRARRYDAEVRARLGHLLEDAVGHLLTGEPAGGRSSETPVAAARRLAGRLLAGGEHG
jgi:LAO/AO transport system kinase